MQTSGSTSYAYNGDGVLVAQTTSSITTRYTQDLGSPLSQILSDGTNRYVYGHERLFGQAGSTRTWYTTDALGSVRQTLNNNGRVLGNTTYDPWGTPQGSAVAPFGFTGELQQGNSVYLRARWYTPGSGTLLGRDPFVGWNEQPDSLHPYIYAGNNAINRIDPSGQWWWGAGQTLFESSKERFQNQNIHVRIQALAMAGQESNVHAEYAGAGLSIDLLDLDGEIWEIKPWDDAAQALVEAIDRVDAMNNARQHGLLRGLDPFGRDYNWNIDPPYWYLGDSFPSGEIYLGMAVEGAWIVDIYAQQTRPGVIVWWKHNRRKGEQVQYPIFLPGEVFWSPKNTRPGWQPQPVPAFPASAGDLISCGALVLAAAATVVILSDPIPGDEILLPVIWAPVVGTQ